MATTVDGSTGVSQIQDDKVTVDKFNVEESTVVPEVVAIVSSNVTPPPAGVAQALSPRKNVVALAVPVAVKSANTITLSCTKLTPVEPLTVTAISFS